jgi:hypothetical protein
MYRDNYDDDDVEDDGFAYNIKRLVLVLLACILKTYRSGI